MVGGGVGPLGLCPFWNFLPRLSPASAQKFAST
jgi:hypothetical protein